MSKLLIPPYLCSEIKEKHVLQMKPSALYFLPSPFYFTALMQKRGSGS